MLVSQNVLSKIEREKKLGNVVLYNKKLLTISTRVNV